jgi:hypothetical protein
MVIGPVTGEPKDAVPVTLEILGILEGLEKLMPPVCSQSSFLNVPHGYDAAARCLGQWLQP